MLKWVVGIGAFSLLVIGSVIVTVIALVVVLVRRHRRGQRGRVSFS